MEGLARRRTSLRLRVVWLSTPEGGRFMMTLFGVTIMGLALLMTRSRSGIACVFLGAILTAMLTKRVGLSRRGGVAAAVVLVLLFVGAAGYAGVDASFRRFVTDSDAVQLRLNIWKDSIGILRDFPVLGTGLNTFGTATTSYQTNSKDLHFQETHNDYLQLLVEGGVVLGIAVLLAIAALVRAIALRLQSDHDDPESRWLRLSATIGLILIAAQSMVEFSLQMPGNAAVFTLLIGLALHRPRSVQS
jgi:O-antigen ligase